MLIRFLIAESPETFMYLINGSFRKYSGIFITTGIIFFVVQPSSGIALLLTADFVKFLIMNML